MKCAEDYEGVKITLSNMNLDLSIKMGTGSSQIADIFIMMCFSMLLVFCNFHTAVVDGPDGPAMAGPLFRPSI